MQRGSKNVKTDAEFHAGRCYRFCLARKIFSACESAANVSGQSQFIRMRSARPRLVRRSRGLQFVGLAMKFCGKLHELAARRIVPRQPFRQPQAGLRFFPEIGRIHRCIPVPTVAASDDASIRGSGRLAVTGITDWMHRSSQDWEVSRDWIAFTRTTMQDCHCHLRGVMRPPTEAGLLREWSCPFQIFRFGS